MALPFTAPTIGLAEVASVADTPHAKPGVNVPVRAPVVGSIVMSTTEPSWLLHVDRPVGTVWAASVNVGAGVEVVGGCPGSRGYGRRRLRRNRTRDHRRLGGGEPVGRPAPTTAMDTRGSARLMMTSLERLARRLRNGAAPSSLGALADGVNFQSPEVVPRGVSSAPGCRLFLGSEKLDRPPRRPRSCRSRRLMRDAKVTLVLEARPLWVRARPGRPRPVVGAIARGSGGGHRPGRGSGASGPGCRTGGTPRIAPDEARPPACPILPARPRQEGREVAAMARYSTVCSGWRR